MKASSKITVVLGDYKEQYNDALENLHRAMKAILPHDLSTVTVMLSVVMVGVSAYDNGFEEHKGKMSYLGLGVSLGNVPVYHGTKLKVLDRRVRIRELVFICSWGRIYSSSITFRNTAGAKNHQAVAFCVLDQTYQCFTNVALKVIKTHYISTRRGNSIECNIYGTVDFIFGNAAVVLQNFNTLQETLPT
ncbi:hypothetical protein JHK86_006184 [Glycine max]|nr:hypothetical protein JHK86_006184 [Glycine max]